MAINSAIRLFGSVSAFPDVDVSAALRSVLLLLLWLAGRGEAVEKGGGEEVDVTEAAGCAWVWLTKETPIGGAWVRADSSSASRPRSSILSTFSSRSLMR